MINHPNRAKRNAHPMDARRDADMDLIQKIADKAVAVYAKHEVRVDRMTIFMDITACHFHGGCKLRLEDLLEANDLNFMHDVGGINRHLDRMTYQLSDGFWPRYANVTNVEKREELRNELKSSGSC